MNKKLHFVSEWKNKANENRFYETSTFINSRTEQLNVNCREKEKYWLECMPNDHKDAKPDAHKYVKTHPLKTDMPGAHSLFTLYREFQVKVFSRLPLLALSRLHHFSISSFHNISLFWMNDWAERVNIMENSQCVTGNDKSEMLLCSQFLFRWAFRASC